MNRALRFLLIAIPLAMAGCASFVLVPSSSPSTQVRYEQDRAVAVQEDPVSGVAISGRTVSSYLALHVAVMNKGMDSADIVPEQIQVRAREDLGWRDLKVYSASQFLQSARDQRSAALGLQALIGILAASQATETTTTVYQVREQRTYYYWYPHRYERYFTVVTTTTTSNAGEVLGETAEQMSRTSRRFDNYIDYLNATLLKANTVKKGDSVEGDVMVEYADSPEFQVTVPFGGKTFTFDFTRKDLYAD